MLDATRRHVESVVVAVVTSTGVYLVGSVYTEAGYGRMSIDATALDLTPPYIALQAAHALQSLLAHPLRHGRRRGARRRYRLVRNASAKPSPKIEKATPAITTAWPGQALIHHAVARKRSPSPSAISAAAGRRRKCSGWRCGRPVRLPHVDEMAS